MNFILIVVFFSLIILVLLVIKIFYINGSKTSLYKSLNGKFVIITGASSGLGEITALNLLNSGATVVFACRNRFKVEKLFKRINDEDQLKRSFFIPLDLSLFSSVVDFVNKIEIEFPMQKIDILINNAGIICDEFTLTQNNVETTLQVNLLSHILLTSMLLPKFDPEGRVINITSKDHYKVSNIDFDLLENDLNFREYKRVFSTKQAYDLSKLGMIYFTGHLTSYLSRNEITIRAVCVNPGFSLTNLYNYEKRLSFRCLVFYLLYPIYWYFSKSPYHAVQTILHLCYMDPGLLLKGCYYENLNLGSVSKIANDIRNEKRFMAYCIYLINSETEERNKGSYINNFDSLIEEENY